MTVAELIELLQTYDSSIQLFSYQDKPCGRGCCWDRVLEEYNPDLWLEEGKLVIG